MKYKLLSLALGVFVASLALGLALGLDARPARAFDPGTLNKESLRVLANLSKDTKSVDAATRARAQRVLTRAMRTAYLKPVPPAAGGAATGTSITPILMRAGLAGAAAGIWVHNGVMIYNGIQCGQADCPDPIVLNAQFQRAADAKSGIMVTRENQSPTGKVTGAIVVTSMKWDHSPSAQSAVPSIKYELQGQPQEGMINFRVTDGTTSDQCRGNNYGTVGSQASGLVGSTSWSGGTQWTYEKAWRPGCLQVGVMGGYVQEGGPYEYNIIHAGLAGSAWSWENPVFDVGEVGTQTLPPGYTPAEGDYVPSADQNLKLLDSIANDPEYDPTWERPWLKEDFRTPKDPAERERLWGPVTKRYYDGAWQCEERTYGVTICEHDGNVYVEIEPDWIAWVEYNDGSKEILIRPEDKPAGGTAEHPWGPNWSPGPEHPGLRPPGDPTEDERIFGPGTKDDRGGLVMVIYHFEDGTVGMYDESGDRFYANGLRKIWRDADGTYSYAGPNEKFRGSVPVCDASSSNTITTVYPDGVTVHRLYPEGVAPEQTIDTQAICERWLDSAGNAMAPGDPAVYPKPVLKDYSQYLQ